MAKNKGGGYGNGGWDDFEDALDGDYYPGASNPAFTGKKGFTPGPAKAACFEAHPALSIGGGTVYGGSCHHPVVKDADFYVGFDRGMHLGPGAMPWNGSTELLFEITDGCAPDNAAEFQKLVEWTLTKLAGGNRLHCGCIGGHGRTGTFIAALHRVATNDLDAIRWVRENYCKKAVESAAQVKFLGDVYGIKPVVGSHELSKPTGQFRLTGRSWTPYPPLATAHSIWGASLDLYTAQRAS